MKRITNLFVNPKTGKLVISYEEDQGDGKMGIVTMQLDPNAQSYTDNEIIAKINTATSQITRVSSVGSAARPIAPGEVSATQLAIGAAKVNLDDMTATTRGYVQSIPTAGKYRVVGIERASDGKLDVRYDDVVAT
jgi:hypothetical protein